jgi:hypothetical protein
MHRLGRSIFALLFAALPLAGCSSEPEGDKTPPVTSPTGDPPGEMPAATGPTFHKDVEPILQKSCQGCHAPGKIAPFGLIGYEDAKAVAGLMATRTAERTMPPWSAVDTADCKPRFGWKDDKRLSEEEIATIKEWNEAGAPKGDPKDAPPAIDVSKEDGLPGTELTLEPQKPYVTSGEKDQFRCFVLDPKLLTDSFLNGSHVLAGNAKVVHHAVLFLDSKRASLTKADADGGYECFGGSGLPETPVVSVWTPGAVPSEYPPNVGMSVPKGSLLVMQIHYHPGGTTADPDLTKVQLRFNKLLPTQAMPEYVAFFGGVGNAPKQLADGDGLQPGPNDTGGIQFMIPAGAKDHTETMRFTVPLPDPTKPPPPEFKIYSSQTHMHYVGTDMRVSIKRPNPQNGEPAEECLIDTPKWDFNWQRSYAYNTSLETLPTLRGGDVLTAHCIYDNSLDNPFVKRALMEEKLTAPKDVNLGENTLDEMCIGLFSLLAKTTP